MEDEEVVFVMVGVCRGVTVTDDEGDEVALVLYAITVMV